LLTSILDLHPWKIVGKFHFANLAIGTDSWLRLRHQVNSNSPSKLGEPRARQPASHIGLAAAAAPGLTEPTLPMLRRYLPVIDNKRFM